MKFCTYTLVDNSPDPISGVQLTPYQRFQHVVQQARGRGAGFRRVRRGGAARAAVPLLVAAGGARVYRGLDVKIRLLTTVTVLSLLDPVRVAEDYATLDQLSGGRLDIIIARATTRTRTSCSATTLTASGTGTGRVRLLRQLLRQEKVSWEGKYRPALSEATTRPRPYQTPRASRSGTARILDRVDRAGGEMGRAAVLGERVPPAGEVAGLIRHYRERWEAYGHDPADAMVGAGFNGLYVKKTSQQAIEGYRPIFDAFMDSRAPSTTSYRSKR